MNQELRDTNRGVVALYAELDERADHLRRADELKSHFLSNMTHEFRTPLNSILALTRVLVVDDEPVCRYLVRRLLPAGAFEVGEAASGAEGPARIAGRPSASPAAATKRSSSSRTTRMSWKSR